MTQDEINQIKEDLTKISPWPWHLEQGSGPCQFIVNDNGWIARTSDSLTIESVDANFLVAAPSRIDALIKEVERLREVLSDVVSVMYNTASEFEHMGGIDKVCESAKKALEDAHGK